MNPTKPRFDFRALARIEAKDKLTLLTVEKSFLSEYQKIHLFSDEIWFLKSMNITTLN